VLALVAAWHDSPFGQLRANGLAWHLRECAKSVPRRGAVSSRLCGREPILPKRAFPQANCLAVPEWHSACTLAQQPADRPSTESDFSAIPQSRLTIGGNVMADTTAVREPHDMTPDLLGVKSRVSWSAIFGGALIALSCYLVLTLLFAAIGISLTEAGVR